MLNVLCYYVSHSVNASVVYDYFEHADIMIIIVVMICVLSMQIKKKSYHSIFERISVFMWQVNLVYRLTDVGMYNVCTTIINKIIIMRKKWKKYIV